MSTDENRILREALEGLMDCVDAPEANCSCHISPPCNDCVEYAETRHCLKAARQAIAATSQPASLDAEYGELRAQIERARKICMDVEIHPDSLEDILDSRAQLSERVAVLEAAPCEVWVVSNKTFSMICATEDIARNFVSSQSGSVGGGMNVSKTYVVGPRPAAPHPHADEAAKVGLISVDHAILERARQWVERNSSEGGYGYARPPNPHDFSPDHECCSEEEIAAHKAACEAFDKGEYTPERGCEWVGKMHILRAPWGIGSYTFRDQEAAELLAELPAAPSSPAVGKP